MINMIKKIFLIFSVILFIGLVNAIECNLEVSMLNQDPYPAVPGDYVKIIFQIKGLENPDCGNVQVTLNEQYPIIFDPGANPSINVVAGTFTKDFSSILMAPYKVRVDKNAVDGNNPIEVSFSYYKFGANVDSSEQSKQFNLFVEDVKADFEIFVKDYNFDKNALILEILNIAESDVGALTIDIPKQDNIVVKGSNREILGDLDSNDYTTAEFEAVPKEGDILINVRYTDTTGARRTLEKLVKFEPNYFKGRVSDEEKGSNTTYVVIGIVVILVVWWFYRRYKRKKRRHAAQHGKE